MKQIKIKINGQSITCLPNQSIMKVARDNNFDIPGLCNHEDFPTKANCRLCVVEIKGRKNLVTSCSAMAEDGMDISTETERVKKARNLNIELLFAEHVEKCAKCIWRFECQLLSFAEKYKILITKFKDRKSDRKKYRFANAVEIDGTQCIDCRNCIDACALLQDINYLELEGKGIKQEVVPTKNNKIQCILCGQCALHCPVSAAQEQASWQDVEKALQDKNKIVVAQFAPSIRVSIGEDFGAPYGKIMTEHVVAGLRELGFKYVFDTTFGADVTTIVEAEELLDRIKNKKVLPLITSCCPGWVNYAEFYRPDLLPNLTTSRSPHIHNGGIVKTYWAEKMKIDPKNIVVVSIMPCTAKKFEVGRKEMMIDGKSPVDYVLTTREFSFMLKKNNINFIKLKKSQSDNPLGEYTGGGVIFGGSGGVMESALRAAHSMACGSKKSGVCKTRIDFKCVRGLEGVREAEVDVAGSKLKVAVVNGIANFKHIAENIDDYHYIEVMACPGGCIGGGGQPIPTTPEIRKMRIEALYKLDKSKKIRNSYENKGARDILKWLKGRDDLEHKVLHTHYQKRIKY